MIIYTLTIWIRKDIMISEEQIIEWLNNLVVLILRDKIKSRLESVFESNQIGRRLYPKEAFPETFVGDELDKGAGLWVVIRNDEEEEILFLGRIEVQSGWLPCLMDVVYIAHHNLIDRVLHYMLKKLYRRGIATYFRVENYMLDHLKYGKLNICRGDESSYVCFFKSNVFIPIVLGDANLLGVSQDFEYFKTFFKEDENLTVLQQIHPIKLSKQSFIHSLTSLRRVSLSKLFVYLSGISHNGEGTNFPLITFSDNETLTQPELANILRSNGIPLVIVGYDCSNYKQHEPPVELNTIATKPKRPTPSPKNNLLNYTGEFYFSATSVGERAYGYRDIGSVFTTQLCHSLELTQDWNTAINLARTSRYLRSHHMTPFFEGELKSN